MPALGLSHGSCAPQWSSHFSSLLSISTALHQWCYSLFFTDYNEFHASEAISGEQFRQNKLFWLRLQLAEPAPQANCLVTEQSFICLAASKYIAAGLQAILWTDICSLKGIQFLVYRKTPNSQEQKAISSHLNCIYQPFCTQRYGCRVCFYALPMQLKITEHNKVRFRNGLVMAWPNLGTPPFKTELWVNHWWCAGEKNIQV